MPNRDDIEIGWIDAFPCPATGERVSHLACVAEIASVAERHTIIAGGFTPRIGARRSHSSRSDGRSGMQGIGW